MRMPIQDTIIKKLQQATCDKTELNRQVLRVQKALKEVRRSLEGTGKHDRKKS